MKHYAANGRTITACGLKCEQNHRGSENSNDGNPSCLSCKHAIAFAEQMNPEFLVLTSEDESKTALRDCKKAIKDAQTLIKKMGGKTPGLEWQYHVWENLGWHYKIFLENLTVGPSGGNGFYAHIDNQWWSHGETAQIAIFRTLKNLEVTSKSLQDTLFDVQWNLELIGPHSLTSSTK